MGLTSPSATKLVNKLVFWSEAETPTSPHHIGDTVLNLAEEDEASLTSGFEHGESMYVTLFEDMLKTVMLNEAYLFTFQEIDLLKRYSQLSYPGRYLLVRLCLRKTDSWFRLNKLKYHAEIGDQITCAIHELCGALTAPTSNTVNTRAGIKVEDTEIVDLTAADDEIPLSGSSKPQSCHSKTVLGYSFAEKESHADLRELLQCLSVDELKAIAKQFKLPASVHGNRRDELINALLKSSSTQSTLPFASFPTRSTKAKGKQRVDVGLVQTKLAFSIHPGRGRTQADRLREIVMKYLGICIKVKEDVVQLFRRVNVVYFRSTQSAPSLLTPSILSRAQKRSYASYVYKRTRDIWQSRRALLDYEEALELEAEVDTLLDGQAGSVSSTRGRSTSNNPSGPSRWRTQTPDTPKKESRRGKGLQRNTKREVNSTHGGEGRGASTGGIYDTAEDGSADTGRRRNARVVKDIMERVYLQWLDMLNTKPENERPASLIRFECGHVLTRIICKGSYALGVLKEYARELEVLEALLSQKRWRRARRGRWHERRALILMTHMGQSEETLLRAMNAVRSALEDEDTHTVFRPKLERRLTKLEKRLKVPKVDRHVCEGKLDKAAEVSFSGVRVYHRTTSLLLDRACRVSDTGSVKDEKLGLSQGLLPWTQLANWSMQKTVLEEQERKTEKATGKSIWIGREGEEVSVEILALQYYEDQHYKGFHCEGRIISTLFGVLFWDVIFSPIPGAFETPYQSAPLDIAEDTFYFSRKPLIESRLKELTMGAAESIVERIYDAEAEKKTWCVGVRWDLFEKEDLMEICRCLGGTALSVVCRLLCEDYAGRVGGVPDLIIWNDKTEQCKFVEVKGPGDRLQENQKVWIDVLLQAGIPVEVCHVFEKGSKDLKGKAGGKKQGIKRKRGDENLLLESEDESEVDYSQLDKSQDLQDELTGLLPVTPRKQVSRKVEVVIMSSPSDLYPSPQKKRRIRELSPEV